jgi:hypothetical protein
MRKICLKGLLLRAIARNRPKVWRASARLWHARSKHRPASQPPQAAKNVPHFDAAALAPARADIAAETYSPWQKVLEAALREAVTGRIAVDSPKLCAPRCARAWPRNGTHSARAEPCAPRG